MTEAPDDSKSVAPAGPPPGPGRRRPSVLGVAGEILITAGLLVLLFLGWQVWWNSLVLAGQQTAAAGAQSQQFLKHIQITPSPTPTTAATPGATPGAAPDYGTPPVMQPVAAYQPFAVLYIPRLGAGWKRVIRETVDENRVLNSYTSGVGHYPGTQMPGQVGNFAIAGHDTGYGNAFVDISDLQLGDDIYVQTKDGWYTYSFRNFEYVQPTAVNVLLPVPREPNAKPVNRIMTITSCNPPYHAAERIIAYNLFDSWQPLSAGPPAAIAAEVAAQGG